MSSTMQHGASGSLCCKNSAVEPNSLGSRPTDRNKLLNASRTSGSSSTTRTTGVSGAASICWDDPRWITINPSRNEARLPEPSRRPRVAGSRRGSAFASINKQHIESPNPYGPSGLTIKDDIELAATQIDVAGDGSLDTTNKRTGDQQGLYEGLFVQDKQITFNAPCRME